MLQLTVGLPFWQWPVPSAVSFTVVKAAPLIGVLAAPAWLVVHPVTARPTVIVTAAHVANNLRFIESAPAQKRAVTAAPEHTVRCVSACARVPNVPTNWAVYKRSSRAICPFSGDLLIRVTDGEFKPRKPRYRPLRTCPTSLRKRTPRALLSQIRHRTCLVQVAGRWPVAQRLRVVGQDVAARARSRPARAQGLCR